MINWKKVGEHIPTNVNKSYPNSPETPFVTCIVWVATPNLIHGGVPRTVRWDTERKCWVDNDMKGDWVFEPPKQITHFCDDINKPS